MPTPPHSTGVLDPTLLAGKKMDNILTIQQTAAIKSIRSIVLTGPGPGGQPMPDLMFEGGTYPAVVTLRTGWTIGVGFVMISRMDNPVEGDITYRNSFPMSFAYADEFHFIVRPGERWYAASAQAGQIVTVIEHALRLMD